MFHVERLQTEEATKNLFFGISEVQQAGSEGAQHANRGTAECRTMAQP